MVVQRILIIAMLVCMLVLVSGCGKTLVAVPAENASPAADDAVVVDDSGETPAAPEIRVTPVCSDSDGGLKIETKGTVNATLANGTNLNLTDECMMGVLVEYYCKENAAVNKNTRCANKCVNGTCA